MKFKLTILIFFSLLYRPAFADVFGGADLQIITELKAMYATMIKTLNEAKTQNEQLNSVKSTLFDIVDTKDYVENFDADRIAKRIQNDFEGVTQMDDLSGMSPQQRIRAVQRMLKRRIDDPDTTPEERERFIREQALLDDIHARNEILELTNQNATKNLVKSSTDLSTRDSGRITAESLSALAQIEAQREIKANNDRMEQIRDQQSLHNLNEQTVKMLGNAKSEGW